MEVTYKNERFFFTILVTLFSQNEMEKILAKIAKQLEDIIKCLLFRYDFNTILIPTKKNTLRMKRNNYQIKLRHVYVKSETFCN